ncbi:hypothetical protein ACIG87_06560 [Micromonospora sp. NPDC051925]|uniref:hypothetical protein n=1 Tax=Micromonospora sp. NPDC051925 TaxID=3364288 RepID=UPI0037C6CA47
MTGVAVVLATVVSALALGVGGTVLLTARSWRTALRVLLDLLVAAGLLRLVGGRSWAALATAAAIIGLRQLLWAGLARAATTSPPTTGPPPWVSRAHPHRGPARYEPDVTGRIHL